jgi:hypothetical protein
MLDSFEVWYDHRYSWDDPRSEALLLRMVGRWSDEERDVALTNGWVPLDYPSPLPTVSHQRLDPASIYDREFEQAQGHRYDPNVWSIPKARPRPGAYRPAGSPVTPPRTNRGSWFLHPIIASGAPVGVWHPGLSDETWFTWPEVLQHIEKYQRSMEHGTGTGLDAMTLREYLADRVKAGDFKPARPPEAEPKAKRTMPPGPEEQEIAEVMSRWPEVGWQVREVNSRPVHGNEWVYERWPKQARVNNATFSFVSGAVMVTLMGADAKSSPHRMPQGKTFGWCWSVTDLRNGNLWFVNTNALAVADTGGTPATYPSGVTDGYRALDDRPNLEAVAFDALRIARRWLEVQQIPVEKYLNYPTLSDPKTGHHATFFTTTPVHLRWRRAVNPRSTSAFNLWTIAFVPLFPPANPDGSENWAESGNWSITTEPYCRTWQVFVWDEWGRLREEIRVNRDYCRDYIHGMPGQPIAPHMSASDYEDIEKSTQAEVDGIAAVIIDYHKLDHRGIDNGDPEWTDAFDTEKGWKTRSFISTQASTHAIIEADIKKQVAWWHSDMMDSTWGEYVTAGDDDGPVDRRYHFYCGSTGILCEHRQRADEHDWWVTIASDALDEEARHIYDAAGKKWLAKFNVNARTKLRFPSDHTELRAVNDPTRRPFRIAWWAAQEAIRVVNERWLVDPLYEMEWNRLSFGDDPYREARKHNLPWLWSATERQSTKVTFDGKRRWSFQSGQMIVSIAIDNHAVKAYVDGSGEDLQFRWWARYAPSIVGLEANGQPRLPNDLVWAGTVPVEAERVNENGDICSEFDPGARMNVNVICKERIYEIAKWALDWLWSARAIKPKIEPLVSMENPEEVRTAGHEPIWNMGMLFEGDYYGLAHIGVVHDDAGNLVYDEP